MEPHTVVTADRVVHAGPEDFPSKMFDALSSIRHELGVHAVYLVTRHGEVNLPAPLREIELFVGQQPNVADIPMFAFARDRERHRGLVGDRPVVVPTNDPRIRLDLALDRNVVDRVVIGPLRYLDNLFGFFCFLLPTGLHLDRSDTDRVHAACEMIGLSLAVRSLNDTYREVLGFVAPFVWEHQLRLITDRAMVVEFSEGDCRAAVGMRCDEMIGRSLCDLVIAEQRESVREFVNGLTDDLATRTVAFRHGDGNKVNCHLRAFIARPGRSGSKVCMAIQVVGPHSTTPDPLAARRRMLSQREREIVDLLLMGKRVATIAAELGLTENTIRNHLKRMFRKLDVSSQSELIEMFSPQRRP